MTSSNIKIIYVDYGLAGNYGDVIKINKQLTKDKELLDFVIDHELNHDNSKFSIKDYLHEFKIKPKIYFKLLKFVILHPSIWYEALPIYYHKEEGFIYNMNLIVTYLLFTIFILFVLKWLKY